MNLSKTSNFEFIRTEWTELFSECARAEGYVRSDPRVAVIYARRVVEQIVDFVYDVAALPTPYKDDLAARMNESAFRSLAGSTVGAKFNLIRKAGNQAAHEARPVQPHAALQVIADLHYVVAWWASRYSTNPAKTVPSQFDPRLVGPPASSQPPLSEVELNRLLRKFEERDAQIAAVREENASLEAELAQLRAEIAAAQSAKTQEQAAAFAELDPDEMATRLALIDVDLARAGWVLSDVRDREYPVTGMPTPNGKGFVDYVLWGADGLPLAIVEAKRTSRDATVGQHQAKLYADCLESMTGQRPVIFYTNGDEVWLWDDAAGYPPRKVQGYFTRDELALMVQRRRTRLLLTGRTVDARIAGRPYQQRAIRNVGEAFDRKQRTALLVMATGSGKTRTVIALVDQLMKAVWVKRVLFLADRIALVRQATHAFTTHLPQVTTVNLVESRAEDGRVYVATYPTMMNLIDETIGEPDRFGPGFFDLVVIDEAHRSVYQKYRAIFEYFDSILVGLTATPKDEVDHNTYALFELEDGVPTDAYSLEEAVAEGYLVPYKALSVPLKFVRQGIRYEDLTEEEKDQWDALEWEEEPPEEVGAEEVNRWLFNADTVDKVLFTLMTRGRRVEGGDRIGKSIIFAKNNRHADFIQQRFDIAYPEHGGQVAQVITYKTEYAQNRLDDFADPNKTPDIAISVDMLDTGIDIPEVVNLVFFKPVRSKTKFWQMIGRGTRLRPDLFGPGEDKQDFFIFDFCGNFEFFNEGGDTVEVPLPKPLGERLFEGRAVLVAALEQAGVPLDSESDGTRTVGGLRHDVARELHRTVAGMNVENFVVRPERSWVMRYADWDAWSTLTPESAREAAEHLGPLPSAVIDTDEPAKRFDWVMLQLQLATLHGDTRTVEALRSRVQQVAQILLGKLSIPSVKARTGLLEDVAGDEWWVDVTLPMLELARRRIRSLVVFIERTIRTPLYTDLEDELGEVTEMNMPVEMVGVNRERFIEKTRAYLRSHEDSLPLQRLKRNRQLTPEDLTELERMLRDAGWTTTDVEKIEEESKGLGLFVRSLVGLDRSAAQDAFAEFLNGSHFTAAQVHFVGTVIDYLTRDGAMEAARLYEPPFTDIAAQGPDFLFTETQVDGLVAILDDVRRHAVPRAGKGAGIA